AGASHGAGLNVRGNGTALLSCSARSVRKPSCQPPTRPATALRSAGDSCKPATHSACSIISGVTAAALSAWAATARGKRAVPTRAGAGASNHPRRVRRGGGGLLMAAFLRGGRDGGAAKLLPGECTAGRPRRRLAGGQRRPVNPRPRFARAGGKS